MTSVSGTVYDSSGAPVSGRTVRAYRRDTGVLLGSTTSSNNTVTPGDTEYNSVSLLLRYPGADASTTFTDESPSPKTVTRSGDAQIDTAQSQWGVSSGLFDGTGDYLSIAANAAFGFGSAAWTIETGVRPGASALACLFETRESGSTGNSRFLIGLEATTRTLFFQYGSNVVGNTGTAPGTSTWSHLEVDYDGTTVYGFVNGALVWSSAVALSLDGSVPMRIGATYTPSAYYNGHLSSTRITKGVARHTAAFTAPTAEHYANLYLAATPVGAYTIDLSGYASEINVIELASVSTRNDLILRTTGV